MYHRQDNGLHEDEGRGSGSLPDALRFDPASGLVPAIVQSEPDGEVRMLGYMNREALERTLETGRVTFWSRSRQALWEKGESSGNWLEAVSLAADCDGDALLVRAVPHGPTCHTGRRSCFGAGVTAAPGSPAASGGLEAGEAPPEIGSLATALAELSRTVARRDAERPEGSYTTRLLEAGPEAPAAKLLEEAEEVVRALEEKPGRLAEESADLLYHLLVLWRAAGLPPGDVGRVLLGRRRAP